MIMDAQTDDTTDGVLYPGMVLEDRYGDEQPLRMELFGHEQRQDRGWAVGHEHDVVEKGGGSDRLLHRLHDNAEVLKNIRNSLVDDLTEKKPITTVGEWLVDNYYVIEEQISLCERHLPKKFLLELPILTNPGRHHLPRVYDLAERLVAYGDSRIDVEDVSVFITAYQEIKPLKLGELWAIPIMLRLALIENIRRTVVSARKSRFARELARDWADKIIKAGEEDPKNLILVIADMAKTNPDLTGPFVAEFKRKLQGRGTAMKLPLQWVEQNLNENDQTIDQLVNEENHIQAIYEVSMRNCVNSLRNLNATDWSEFVETMSLVEKTLREDPADVYAKMDFNTRDDYRRVVETLARKSNLDEVEVAKKCLELARNATVVDSPQTENKHVGYYLVGPGEQDLMRAVGFRIGIGDYLRHASSRHTLFIYLGAIIFLTILFTTITVMAAHAGGVHGDMLLILTILLACSTSHLAVALVNFLATQLVAPRPLPRLDYSKGIPAEQRTLVVVPVIINNIANARKQLRNLEMHYLNNRGDNIHFGLLTDFPDAPEQNMPQDGEILTACIRGIEKLNDRYSDHGGNNFYLFHRPRKWNSMEEVWMGWERKRGKLEDLNRFLRGKDPEVFSHVVGKTGILSNVKYIITLDADTVMSRDSAWQLVGTMAHPLIRPVYDESLGRVVKGHGILQPRVDPRLAGAHRSHYARMSALDIGIDPYTRASSDVYQDLFDEGSFIGKGIYDVEIFDHALGGRFPDNKILSHDLLEGCVVRSGLINDVKLYEDPPVTYLSDVKRRHRWVRGDWQIASYLVAAETRRGFKTKAHPLNLLSQWKVFDNLRRSLTPVFLLLLLVFGLTALTNPELNLVVVACIFLVPVLVGALCGLVRKSPDKTLGQHIRKLASSTLHEAVDVFFHLSCLPYEAFINADAIIRSLWRQGVSRKHLLQWNPYDNTHDAESTHFGRILRRMWISPVAAIVMSAFLAWRNPGILLYAAPLFLLWFLAPLFATWLSRPLSPKGEVLSDREALFLRQTARRIWRFFEEFINAGENWLPPDNYQEYPKGVVAHRTSPTNMGLSLLANLSAYDFGFATMGRLLDRTEAGLTTMLKLERFRGHFYNWYETETLSVLRPSYISSVDSGNLAGHALILATGIKNLMAAPIVEPKLYYGLSDTLELAVQEAENRNTPLLGNLEATRQELCEAIRQPAKSLAEFRVRMAGLASASERFMNDCQRNQKGEERCRSWLAAFNRECREILDEIDCLAPWARLYPERKDWWSVTELLKISSLMEMAELDETLVQIHGKAIPVDLVTLVRTGAEFAQNRIERMQELVLQCEDISNIDFDFLYDPSKHLLSIGYNVDERRLDPSFYDLLASEARLASYIGIAQNKLPQKSWWSMGRMLTLSGGHPLLISWSGSMFEYLMPLLVMPSFEDTLLNETYKSCVSIQMEYGSAKHVPWGISESGYNVFDSDQNYQYRAFGVPELGLKHGLAEDLVIAPYATVLAAMVYPVRACKNLKKLASSGCLTSYGFYEAVDYTQSRIPYGSDRALIRSFMAHHQGMSLIALGQALLDKPMHRRFAANPMLQSASMLLQEMVPAEKSMYFHSSYSPEIRTDTGAEETPMRVISTPNTPHPEVQLLSNGNYHVMVTAAGGGYSRWRDVSITRWREDPALDNWGAFCYLRDREDGEVWSTTYQPTRKPSAHFEAIFVEGKAEFNRRDANFDSHTEIVVSPEDDVEIRRVRITNRTAKRKTLDITSYTEIALNGQAADDSHQAFSKLFVETEIVRDRQAIICARRPRSQKESMPLMFHMLAVRGEEGGAVSYETDRLRFLGRGRTAADPKAIYSDNPALGNSEGSVLDPVAAIRTPVTLESGGTVIVDLVTGVAGNRNALAILLEKYQDQKMADKTFDLAWSHSQLLLRQLNVSDSEAQKYCQLAGSVVYVNPLARAEHSTLVQNRKGQSGLWSYAISGDLPIVLLKIEDPAHLQLISQMLQAHTYWKQKGLKVDLVILNEDKTSYRQVLHDQIMELAGAVLDDANMEQPGGIFLRAGDRIPDEDRILFHSVARVVMSDSEGLLEDQVRQLVKSEKLSSSTIVMYRNPTPQDEDSNPVAVEALSLANGYGGFTPDGKEYVITLAGGKTTPLPWVNVIANENFGTLVSESGASNTWSENAHEFRLTPWTNDPVSDGSGEALYLRDELTGDFWSPSPYPCRSGRQYVVRHGFGYSVYEHNNHGIASKLTIHVDREAPVKFMTLKVRNNSASRRTLSATSYVEWVLGDLRTKSGMHIVTAIDQHSGALFAQNNYNDEFRGRTAFLDTDDPGRTVSGDRTEFIGRNGYLGHPFAMHRANLSGRTGAGMDACGALQVKFTLAPNQEREIVFRLGSARTEEEAHNLVKQFRGLERARESLKAAIASWREILDAIQVDTPDMAFNFMANGWLLYQALSCRFWGRTAVYQSGGAFGFRDQLQDSMAFLYAKPELVRKHLLECAAHQFVEGDVMHWWHPPVGRGVRTRCSDDYLWLPHVAVRYLAVTGDDGVLDEKASFLQGRPVPDNEESYYDLPQIANEQGTLYEHCKRAILHGLRFGRHGLPLMGTGDWNDGMDLVGFGGEGESVWLAFFLYDVLLRFAPVAKERGDDEFAERCQKEAADLAKNVEENAWDGEWYKRAFFDDGTPLGSSSNQECRIDSIAQSWAVISGLGAPERVRQGMGKVDEILIDREHLLIKLFTPPFDKAEPSPGYIRGYVPGVRENGGQYTHAAIWVGIAHAILGDPEKTWEVQRLLNPVNHALDVETADRYKVEPYVASADIYASRQHDGRGGWSWYTGSASWLYRLFIEYILGFSLESNKVEMKPCVPGHWAEYHLICRAGEMNHIVNVKKSKDNSQSPTVDINEINVAGRSPTEEKPEVPVNG